MTDVIDRICGRRSVSPKYLHGPAPSAEEIREMVRAACAAPDHGRLSPVRFTYIPDDRRPALADVFVAAALEANPDMANDQLQAARERALHAPCLLAIVAHIREDNPQVPPYEQWIAVGAALQNVLLSAESLGYRAKIVSGQRVHSHALRSAFALNDAEHLVGFIAMGSSSQPVKELPRKGPDEIVNVWQE